MKGETSKCALLLLGKWNHCKGGYIINKSSTHCLMPEWVTVTMYIFIITEVLKEEYQRAEKQQCSLKLFIFKQE